MKSKLVGIYHKDNLTDEKLMEKVRDGELNHLGTLYERYKQILFNYFIRVTNNYDASNDLIMETFERIYKYRNSYRGSKKFRNWLFQISNNLINDYYRKSNRLVPLANSNYESETVKPNSLYETNERHKMLYAAMTKLTVSERNIINMYYLLEMTYEEIANTKNISINNARIKICRGLKKLNDLLKKSGI